MKANFKRVVNAEQPVLVDFYADWCGPCQTLAPILKEVKSTLGDALKIIKVDVDENPALANKFQVRGVPTLLLFKEGDILWRHSGLMSKRELLQTLESLINK